QWAASCPAALCIFAPVGVGAGNELGNVVAYRPRGGSLKLYSIFTTPDSQADNFTGTGGQNRLYEAVGTVVDNPTGGVPAITWRNYEIWHGPVGARYDKIFPVTAVDAAGHVYAVWTDGGRVYAKSSSGGTGCGSNARTLLDFFQVAIDPTNGAADIAYADDHASPGNPVVYFTRQCSGVSATTGLALADDCVAPPPPPTPPQGTTCPGPQVADFTGDAPNNDPAGDG